MARKLKGIAGIALAIILVCSLSIAAFATQGPVTFIVEKVWNGGPTPYPDIELILNKDGSPTETPTPTPVINDNVWTYTYTGLPNGNYSVTELNVENYTTSYAQATALTVGAAEVVNPCNELSFPNISTAYIVIKLTGGGNSYLAWTHNDLSKTEETSFLSQFTAKGFPNTVGNTVFISEEYDQDGTKITPVSDTTVHLEFEGKSIWSKFAYGTYTLTQRMVITNNYVAPKYNVSYTDGTNTYDGSDREEGVDYTVLTFAETGLSAPANKHFIGWTTDNGVSTTIGESVAQPAGDVLYTAQFADDGDNDEGGDNDDNPGTEYPPYVPPVTPEEETGVAGETEKEDEPEEEPAPTPEAEEESQVAGESEVLPQTGGISAATLAGIAGLILLGSGLVMFFNNRKKREE
ncbi:MAG: Cna B-type domain-containing protein [Clostridiales bacterium]|nr:Cna B-type domain-containing protein [Clostridiales bacterium]